MYTPDALVKLAVQDIVSHINTGLSPQEATTKVAKELCLNHNFIKRSAEAINVALHHSHFKNHPDAKADDFPTVDAQKVAEDIYGSKEKTASASSSELFSSFQYPELTPKFARYLEEGPYKKAFKEMDSVRTISKYATSAKGLCEKGSNYISKLKKIAYEKEAEAMDAKYQVDKSFCDILRKFAKDSDYRSSWDSFETAVFSKYGEASNSYLDLLYKASGLKEERGKHDADIKLAAACPELELYDKFKSNVVKCAEAHVSSDDAVHNLNFEQGYLKQAFITRGCELYEVDYDNSSLLQKVEQSIKEERIKAAAVNSEDPVIASIAEKTATNLTKFDERIKCAKDLFDYATAGTTGAYDKMSKPTLTANSNTPSKNRERALMLQELVTTDPIISKFPTHQVVDAYQQMLRVAPELSDEKEIVRAHLRQAGAGQALDSFTADQLVKTNTNLFRQHQLQQGQQVPPPVKAE